MDKIFKREELVSAIDIEGDIIKLAQVKINDKRRILHRLVAAKSPSASPEDISKTIRNLAPHFKLANSLVLVNLPRHMVTVREIKMPSVNMEELDGMVGLQSSKLLPYPKEEVVYDYKIIETTPEGYSQLMLVLTHRDVITKTLQLFKQSNMDINRIALSSETLSFWYLSRRAEQPATEAIALIDICSSSADIQIISDGKLRFTRAITFSPEDKLKQLLDEIRLSFYTYHKESKTDIAKIVLTGAESVMTEEAPFLKKEFNIPTVYINPLRAWPLATDSQLPSEEERKRISFASVLALAFNFDKLDLNLLPQVIQQAKTAKLVKESLFMTGLLALFVILSIAGIIWKKLDDKTDYLRYVNAQIKETDPKVGELTKMVNNVNIIKRQLDMSGTSIDIIRELYSLIPTNISLTILDFEESASCTLRGVADELSDIFKFITTLENSPYFKNVKVRYATKRPLKREAVTDFEIICELEENPQAEAK